MSVLIYRRTFVQKSLPKSTSSCATDPMCLSDKAALLKNLRTGLIDPDTPQSAMNKQSHDGVNMQLVVCISRTHVRGYY
jgi:beta-glucan synthesis-associated protein KRE6